MFASELAYLLPIIAVFIAFLTFGVVAAVGVNSRKCDGCGQKFIGETDLLVHKKTCIHRDVAVISNIKRAA